MALPPIYEHALRLYRAFEDKAADANSEEAELYSVAEGTQLYIGNWSLDFVGREDLARESTLQKAYAWLQDVGCVEVLKRGQRDHPGVVELRRPPTPADVDDLPADSRYQRSGRLGVVEVTVQALVKRIGELESALAEVNGRYDAIVRDSELQLTKLSNRISELDTRTEDLAV